MGSLREDIINRLKSFGYLTKPEDDWVLNFIIVKVENNIKNGCNLPKVPDGLHEIAVDMACGEFLLMKKGAGGSIAENLPGFDFDNTVKRIVEGDTTVEFAIGSGNATPEQRLDTLIGYLLNKGRGAYAKYRRFVW